MRGERFKDGGGVKTVAVTGAASPGSTTALGSRGLHRVVIDGTIVITIIERVITCDTHTTSMALMPFTAFQVLVFTRPLHHNEFNYKYRTVLFILPIPRHKQYLNTTHKQY